MDPLASSGLLSSFWVGGQERAGASCPHFADILVIYYSTNLEVPAGRASWEVWGAGTRVLKVPAAVLVGPCGGEGVARIRGV